MKQVILKTIFPAAVLILTQLLPAFAGGGDFMEFSWEEIKQVKGGVRKCVITADEEESMFPETTALFDQKGRLIQMDTGYSIQKFFYGNNGLTEIQYGAIDENNEFLIYGKTLYNYNAKGKLVKIVYMDAEGNEYMAEEGITYDKNGNIKIERVTPEGSVYKIDTYNSNMDLIESLVYTGESVAMGLGKKEIESKITIKYDKNNNPVEKVTEYNTVPDESIPKTIVQSYKYEYSKQGNKTLQETTLTPEEAAPMFLYLLMPPMKFRYSSEEEKPKKEKAPDVTFKIDQEVTVLWEGSWYQAVILEQDGNKYLIHYADYDSSWDEWVTADRIKP